MAPTNMETKSGIMTPPMVAASPPRSKAASASSVDARIQRAKAAAQERRKQQQTRKTSVSAPDQYEDGVAASVWEHYIGEDRESRYKEWLIGTLNRHHAVKVLDVACGTGVDSRMLVEAGFEVTSCDLSLQMLSKAKDIRDKKQLKNWDLRQADWCKLPAQLGPEVEHDFDAVICMGNSFAHLPDDLNKQEKQRLAISNFREMLRPGGILIIDHRNFDYIVANGRSPAQNIYYKSTWETTVDTRFERDSFNNVLSVVLDYSMTVPPEVQAKMNIDLDESNDQIQFQLTYFPHYLSSFKRLLRQVFQFPEDKDCTAHEISADFTPIEEASDPAYYIHVVRKQKRASSTSSTDGVDR